MIELPPGENPEALPEPEKNPELSAGDMPEALPEPKEETNNQ